MGRIITLISAVLVCTLMQCLSLCYAAISYQDPGLHANRPYTTAITVPLIQGKRWLDFNLGKPIDIHQSGRSRRDAAQPSQDKKLLVNVTQLKDDRHNEAIVHWSGNNSRAIFLLTRLRDTNGNVTESALYRSIDYGATFTSLSVGDPRIALVYYYYVCPNNKEKLIFVDLKNRVLYVTRNEGNTFKTIPFPSASLSADRLLFHPKQENWLLLYSEIDRLLYFSSDLAESWSLVRNSTNSRFFWGVAGFDAEDVIHLEVEDIATGEFVYSAVKSPYPTAVDMDTRLVPNIEIGSLIVQKEYIFVQTSGSILSAGLLFVSYRRGPFRRAYFPHWMTPMDFVIIEASDGQVLIAANHIAGAVTLYLSDVTGRFFVNSLTQVVALNRGDLFQVDLYEVKGMRGTYIANRHGPARPQTYITFDQGGEWKLIPAPDTFKNGSSTNCKLNNGCSLYIHLQMDSFLYGIPTPLSDDGAPGLILAQGIIGSDSTTRFLMSQDGGVSWKVALDGMYRKAILDQGGAIVAVEFNSTTHVVSEIQYSCDEGTNWKKYSFEEYHLKVDGLLTEPGITTLVCSIYGHRADSEDGKYGWIVAKVNFSQLLSQPCKPSDYTFWSPSSGTTGPQCLLGEHAVFERRRADVECFNGEDYERAVNLTRCDCVREDFECDYGYDEAQNETEKCVVSSSWFKPDEPVEDCDVGQQYLKSKGYRRVASDRCIDSAKGSIDYEPEKAVCPVMKPEGLVVERSGRSVIRAGMNVTFTLSLQRGNQSTTRYAWKFGDGSTLNVTGLVDRTVHLYKSKGFYDVEVIATSEGGSDTATIRVWVQDELLGLYVGTSHAARVNRPITLQVTPFFKQNIPAIQDGVHFLWLFGDEATNGASVGALSWTRSMDHTYTKTGNYSVWVEAFNGVGSVSRSFIIPVYATSTIVRLTLRGLRMPYTSMDTSALEDLIAETLQKVLAFELSVDASRLDIEFGGQLASIVYVSVLPRQQTMSEDETINEIVNALVRRSRNGSIQFQLPDEAFGAVTNITIIEAVVLPDDDDPGMTSRKLIGYAIGIPVTIIILVICACIVVHYRKKLRNLNHYRVLHSRYRGGSEGCGGPDSLGEDTDDDEPLIDPSVERGQRLALGDDDDMNGAEILMSGSERGVALNTSDTHASC